MTKRRWWSHAVLWGEVCQDVRIGRTAWRPAMPRVRRTNKNWCASVATASLVSVSVVHAFHCSCLRSRRCNICSFVDLILNVHAYLSNNQGRDHVFKVGGPIPWSRVLLPFYRKKLDRSTQFGAVGYIITLYSSKSYVIFGGSSKFWGDSDPRPLQWLRPCKLKSAVDCNHEENSYTSELG